MALSSVINAPLLGCFAYFSWPLLGRRRDNLFYKSPIGNTLVGFLIPVVAVYSAAYSLALLGYGLLQFDMYLMNSLGLLRLIGLFLSIWGSYLFIVAASAFVGLVFGELKDRRRR